MTTIIKTFILILSLIIGFSSHATIHTVKQDGSGNYAIIQNAVDATIDTDTVLVWPGTYFENINIHEKNIIVGSLTLTTGDLSYINQTIIDGNHAGSCFDIFSYQETIVLHGFKLQHGYVTRIGAGSSSGGAIIINNSFVSIINCVITDNQAEGYGGGIYLHTSSIFLSNTTIKNNHSYKCGGGILLLNSQVEFDTINKCNIYLNSSPRGTDIYKLGEECGPLHVVVDTFTVLNPDYYYLYSVIYYDIPEDDITFEINAEKTQSVTQDLYVAPNGNNQNSGLTPDEALKDIYYALLKIIPDSISPHTIHIANGMYTLSGGEKFPLSIKRDINIVGQSRDSTILDAEDQIYFIYGINKANNYSIRNITMQHGNGNYISQYGSGAVICVDNKNSEFKNILFKENYGIIGGVGVVTTSNGFVVDSVDFVNNVGGKAFRAGYTYYYGQNYDTITIKNCKVIENYPDYSPEMPAGGGITVTGQTSSPKLLIALFYNCLFIENECQTQTNFATPEALTVANSSVAYLINCTLSANVSYNPLAAAIGTGNGSDLYIYNSIVYDNEYASAYMATADYADESNLYIYNTLFEGGEEGIQIYYGDNYIYYDETNIDTDPLFYGGTEYPYNLSDLSPCIDAGTLDLPDWIELPEFDLAGNPRIVGSAIDMGAYEWNPTVGVNEYQPIKKEKEKLLSVAPNPFSTSTIISAKFPVKSHVKLEIYNNYGQRVKAFMNDITLPGASHIVWDGTDLNNQTLPTGIYYVVMFVDDKEVESVKVIKN